MMTSQIALTMKITPTIRTLMVQAKKLIHVVQQLFLILRMALGATAVLQATTLRRNSACPRDPSLHLPFQQLQDLAGQDNGEYHHIGRDTLEEEKLRLPSSNSAVWHPLAL
jgi:hypothetical protein